MTSTLQTIIGSLPGPLAFQVQQALFSLSPGSLQTLEAVLRGLTGAAAVAVLLRYLGFQGMMPMAGGMLAGAGLGAASAWMGGSAPRQGSVDFNGGKIGF